MKKKLLLKIHLLAAYSGPRLYLLNVGFSKQGSVHMSPVSEMSHLPMNSPPNIFTIKINIAFI